MIQEFKELLVKGNLVMPIIAIPFGQPDFTSMTLEINGSIIAWGSFVTNVVIFLLTALVTFFFIVEPYNAFEARQDAADEEEEEDPSPSEIDLLTEIRDALNRSAG